MSFSSLVVVTDGNGLYPIKLLNTYVQTEMVFLNTQSPKPPWLTHIVPQKEVSSYDNISN